MGDGGKIPPLTVRVDDRTTVTVEGKIDRVDLFRDGKENYVRIVDYKSGGKEFQLDAMAQGLNLGLGDAAGLADALKHREHFRRIGDLRVLRRYARSRAPALLAMRAATDGLYRLFTPQDPLLGWVRNAGMALVDRLPPVKRALIAGASTF